MNEHVRLTAEWRWATSCNGYSHNMPRRKSSLVESVTAFCWDIAYRFEEPFADHEYTLTGSWEDATDENVSEWVADLRKGEADLRSFRLQVEALRSVRKCGACGEPLAGRSDRRYCSSRCRVRAHRESKA
jgi:hypothetical protein